MQRQGEFVFSGSLFRLLHIQMYEFVLVLVLCSQLLHRVLVAEVNALQGMAAIGQRPLLMEVREPTISKSIEFRRGQFLAFFQMLRSEGCSTKQAQEIKAQLKYLFT